MATAGTADPWRQSGGRSDRSSAAARAPRPDRVMNAERARQPLHPSAPLPGRAAQYGHAPASGRPRKSSRGHDTSRGQPDQRRPGAGGGARRGASAGTRGRTAPSGEVGGTRLRGTLAVLAMFLVTLAGAGVDSFVGVGLGLVTLVSLVAVTVVATLLVRRRDLISVLVAPPLVFAAVAAVNIGLAPSASFNLPTIATLLVRSFPTMAVATGAALVLGLVRLAARR
jgi:hypothetical protein